MVYNCLTNFLPTSYPTSYQFLTNFLPTSHQLLTNFFPISYHLLTSFLPTLYTCIESEGGKETRIRDETVTMATTNLGGKGYSPATPPTTPPCDELPCVKVEGISASWSYERAKLVLSNISVEVNKVSWKCCVWVGASKYLLCTRYMYSFLFSYVVHCGAQLLGSVQ